MKKRKRHGADFQLSARVVTPPPGSIRGKVTQNLLRASFDRWLDGEEDSWVKFRLMIWGEREIERMDYSAANAARTRALATTIRRALQDGRLSLGKVGKA